MNKIQLSLEVFQVELSELSTSEKQLIQKSKDAVKLSHSPYSKFKVGCAISTEKENIILGANQENAAYPICLCAEGVALATVASQYSNEKIEQVAIYVPLPSPSSPCGLCRQSFKEYEVRMKRKFRYFLVSDQAIYTFNGIDNILPLAFSSSDLEC